MERTKQSDSNNCKTPTKSILSFHGLLKHQLVETPPSCNIKVKNPFEAVLRENLGSHFISPSLFAKKTPIKTDSKFKWTIDELSILKPAEIDEDASNQYESPERDSHYESIAQSKIDSYFSMQEILPSPCVPCEQIALIHANNDDCSSPAPSITHTMCSSSAQTVLSLPPTLPEELEKVLQPYFNFTQDQQQIGCEVRYDDALYKQLFDLPEADESEDSVEEAEVFPLHAVPRIASPPHNTQSTLYQRTIGTPGNYDTMNMCGLSPIGTKPRARAYLANSSQMRMDGSFNVPDCSSIAREQLDTSGTSHHSGELSTSRVRWDLEYEQLASPVNFIEDMDVSKANTPKQRSVTSQRKKLSDSFGDASHSDDDDLMMVSQQSIKEGGESGYHTVASNFAENNSNSQGTSPTEEPTANSLWESLDVVSSTPTKRNQGMF